MKIAARICLCLALVLSHVMCATVAYSFASMLCAVRHHMTSAPASVAFLLLIPFLAAIAICLVLSAIFRKKAGGES